MRTFTDQKCIRNWPKISQKWFFTNQIFVKWHKMVQKTNLNQFHSHHNSIVLYLFLARHLGVNVAPFFLWLTEKKWDKSWKIILHSWEWGKQKRSSTRSVFPSLIGSSTRGNFSYRNSRYKCTKNQLRKQPFWSPNLLVWVFFVCKVCPEAFFKMNDPHQNLISMSCHLGYRWILLLHFFLEHIFLKEKRCNILALVI